MTEYPMTVRMSQVMIDELRGCELGSFEDYEGLRDSADPEDKAEAAEMIFGTTHRYDILGRRKACIEMRSIDEVAEVYYGAATGTFQINRADEGGTAAFYKAAVRLCDKLRPILRAAGGDYKFLADRDYPSGF